MSTLPPALSAALQALDHALDAPRRSGVALGNWRWVVRQRIAQVRDGLVGEVAGSDDGWLAARGGAAFRERNALLTRLGTLGPQVLETPDVEATRVEAKRLVLDIHRHVREVRDRSGRGGGLERGGAGEG